MALTQILLLVEADTEPSCKKSKAFSIEKYVLLQKKLLRDRSILEAFQLNGFQVVVNGILKCSKNKTFDLMSARIGADPSARGKPLLYVDQLHQEYIQQQCKRQFSVMISDGTTPGALSKEDSKTIRKLLASGCKIHYKDEKGSTFLHFLTETGPADLLQLFLNNSCKINAKKSDNATALHIAAERKSIQKASLLLANGANVNVKMVNGSTPLTLAVKEGALNVVGLLVANGAAVNTRMRDGTTPLRLAFEEGSERMIELLIKNGAKTNVIMQDGSTPLISEVKKDNVKVTELLIANGASVNFRSSDGSTPLILAVKKDYLKMAKLLITNGANVNFKVEDGSTPLILAVKNDSLEMAELLIANGADVSAARNNGTTPLHVAASRGCTKIVEHLLCHGANPNIKSDGYYYKGSTPLHVAVRCNYPEIVSLLLEKGANVNADCSDEETALYWAVNCFCPKVIEVLVRYGPDVNNAWNKEAFKLAISKRDPDYRQMTSCLLQSGFDVSAENAVNPDVLFGAVSQNLHQVVEKLLNFGASASQSNGYKQMPLHQAAEHADGNMVQLLVDHGANINVLDECGHTPLSIAVWTSNSEAAKALLANNAVVRKPSNLLHSAIEECPGIVQLLLENGADVNAKNYSGETPSFVAMRCNKPDLLELLLKFEACCGVRHTNHRHTCHYRSSKLFEAFLNYDFGKLDPISEGVSIRNYLNRLPYEEAEVLSLFLVKMTAAYESISLKELIPTDLYSRLKLSCFAETCQVEIAEMKQRLIGLSSITFFNVLTTNTRKVTRWLRNGTVSETLKELDVSGLYPHYGPIIECQLRKGTWRRESVAKGIKLFRLPFSGFRRLPDELKECIVDLLSNQDILVLQKCLQKK